MIHVSEVIRGWLGWCPNTRVTNTGPVILTTPPATTQPVQPGGGTGGPGRTGRGLTLALGSIKILLMNPRLLWFSLLTGFVMSIHLASILYIEFISGINPLPGMAIFTNSPDVIIAKGSVMGLVLTFTIAFFCTFLTYYLLAGLITCVSSLSAIMPFTIREGISRAGNHVLPLAGWAVIEAFLGTANYYIINSGTISLRFTLLSTGLMSVFFVLTMFIVPAVVLDDKKIFPAIRESLSVFRKTWEEIVVCFGMLFFIVFVLYLVTLIPIIFIGFSAGGTALAGFAVILTLLVLTILIFIGSTIVGIATLGLYTYGKNGKIPLAFEEKTGGNVLA